MKQGKASYKHYWPNHRTAPSNLRCVKIHQHLLINYQVLFWAFKRHVRHQEFSYFLLFPNTSQVVLLLPEQICATTCQGRANIMAEQCRQSGKAYQVYCPTRYLGECCICFYLGTGESEEPERGRWYSLVFKTSTGPYGSFLWVAPQLCRAFLVHTFLVVVLYHVLTGPALNLTHSGQITA